MEKTNKNREKSSKVILLPCNSYEENLVYEMMRQGLQMLGGLSALIDPEEKILLKPNLVRKAPVERAVITHPVIVGMMARILQEEGYHNVACGDSCGVGQAQKAMKDTGMDEYLLRYGAEIVDFHDGGKVSFPEGKFVKEFMLSREVQEADALISLSKMKTHALERITGALKNQYGCVWGLHKAKGHTIYPTPETFACMLADLNRLIRPRLYIMDGITAMEGNGPTSGDPVPMNMILMSKDPIALDTVFAHLIHLDPQLVPTISHGDRMGLGHSCADEIRIFTPDGEVSVEEAVEKYGRPDFSVDRKKIKSGRMVQLLKLFKPFQKRPYILEDKCRKCGICVESCPVEGKALTFAGGKEHPPKYNYKKCIRCFCCQEMCPYQAIHVKGSFIK